MTERTPEQRKAIEIILGRAPDIQDDLRNYISKITEPYVKVIGQGSRIFDFAELVGYRINNSLLDIAEDLDLEERYDLINDQPRNSVGSAFRGYNGKHFPEHKFYGLFGKGVHGTKTNDIIEGIRHEKSGQKGYANGLANLTPKERFENGLIGGLISGRKAVERGDGIHALTPKELSKNGQKGYANGLANLTPKERFENGRIGGLISGLISRDLGVGIHAQTPKERIKNGRKSAESKGNFLWLEEDGSRKPELDTLDRLVEESTGRGYYSNKPSWDYVKSEFYEETGLELSNPSLRMAHKTYNQNRISDEEE
jgi:hypothetical protein